MKNNIVGIDWDNIHLKTARNRQAEIERKEKAPTLLYKTKHGYHIEIIYTEPILITENLRIREKYYDCRRRLEYSRLRLETTGHGHDILFNMKKGVWRRLLA